jgi:chromosome segregation ATPase
MFSPGRTRVSQTAELPFSELRQTLLEKASDLQQFIPFQASVQPHIEHLLKEIAALTAQKVQYEEKTKEMEMELAAPRRAAAQMSDEEREAKIARIRELEAEYERLLVEKAKYLELGEHETSFG